MGDLAKEIQSTFSSDKVKAMLNIIYTANWINNHQTQFFKPYGISPQQYNVLRILRGAKQPLTVRQVKQRMIERAPNTTRMMDKLCAKACIDRKPSTVDRRVVHVAITKSGLDLLTQIDTSFKIDLLANLSMAEAKQLSALLDKIR